MIKRTLLAILIIAVSIILFSIIPISEAANIIGPNYRNVTVRTFVNITNSMPEILGIVIYQDTNITLRNITLSAGDRRVINCNISVRDWNGYGDILRVNATLWDTATASSNSTDNNNSHYFNSSCTTNSSTGTYTGNYVCGFSVWYYANNGTWACNASAIDTFNKTGQLTNYTNIYALYALNVTDGIDYGNVAVEDVSTEVIANITNFGNRPINITVRGYGATVNDGLAMNCTLNGNISISNERFSVNSTGTDLTAWSLKTNLTSSTTTLMTNFTIFKQNDSTPRTNNTYWQLYVPPNPAGNCTGYIIFTAESN